MGRHLENRNGHQEICTKYVQNNSVLQLLIFFSTTLYCADEFDIGRGEGLFKSCFSGESVIVSGHVPRLG